VSELKLKDFDNNAPTDVEKWLELYKKFGSNLTAYTDKGHLENIIDWLIEQVDEAYREGIAWERKRIEMEQIIKGEQK